MNHEASRAQTYRPEDAAAQVRVAPARRKKPAMLALKLVIGAAFLVAAVVVVSDRREELSGVGALLGHVRPMWLVVAIVAEALSVLAVTYQQKTLLRAGGVPMGTPALAGITLAANALGTTLPGGQAWATVFTFRQYVRKGSTGGIAAWTLIAVAALSGGALAALAMGGIVAASDNGPSPAWGLWLLVGITAAIAIGMVIVLRHPRFVVRSIVRVVRIASRLMRRPADRAATAVERAAGQMLHVHPGAGPWTWAFVFAMLNWLADCGCLCAGFLAIGAPVPWRGLLLAYTAGQLVTVAALTPGGIGVVEGSLTATLVAYGAGDVSTIAAVLLYRAISYWSLLAVGWPAWAFLHYRRRGSTTLPPGQPGGQGDLVPEDRSASS